MRPIVNIIGVIVDPIPHKIPIALTTQMKEAVVIPTILSSVFIITPPPRNPIPVTIVDKIRVGSELLDCASIRDPIVNTVAPTQIKIFVLRPATLFFFSRHIR